VSEFQDLWRNIGYDNLLRWDPEFTTVVPDIAKSFEVNDAGTEYIFHLRAGMKWSDGEPFTADDIAFWFEDVIENLTDESGDLMWAEEVWHLE
jgi:peptide/nickel transport system substrate-binding protein